MLQRFLNSSILAAQLEVTPDYTRHEYREKIEAHPTDLRDRTQRDRTQAAGMGGGRN